METFRNNKEKQLKILDNYSENTIICNKIRNYYYKYIDTKEDSGILLQKSLSKYINNINGCNDMLKGNDYQDIINISEKILNQNGFKVDKSEWFLELHKYNITESMYKEETKENIFLSNHRAISNLMITDNSIPGKKYRRYSDFEWHDDDCNNLFKCNTIIYFLNKMPEKNVGGNFYWIPKNMKGEDTEKEKIKIENNMILLMRGDISHSPGWFLSDKKQRIYRYSVVVQIKISE